MTQMRYRFLGSSGIKVSELCLGTMMFGGATDEAQARRIIDHAAESGVNFIDTADVYADGRSEAIVGPAIKAKRDRWVLATKGAQQMGPNVTDTGPLAPLSDARGRCQPEAAADRPHRSLLHPPRRSLHALGADDRRVRRPDPPGQDPRMGALQRARLAHPARRASVPADGRAAAGRAAALLQPDEPPARDRAAAGRQVLQPRRRALQPAGARRAHRQVQGQPGGRARHPRRPQGRAHAGSGVAPREPDHRREAEGARRGARHHAGALGDGLGAQQRRRDVGHRRSAHARAMDQLSRRARLQVDGGGRGARQQPGDAGPSVDAQASTIRPIPIEGRFPAVG